MLGHGPCDRPSPERTVVPETGTAPDPTALPYGAPILRLRGRTLRHASAALPARLPVASLYSGPMQQPMYHPDDLASMDPLVLMKNLDHVRMTSRRLSYILQNQVHLYRPEANELRMQIDQYVEAERAMEAELARRQIRA